MLPSSAIQIIERTSSRLVVVDPPYYLIGIGLLATWAVSLPVVLAIGLKYEVTRKVMPWWLLGSLPFIVGGLMLCTGKTVLTFSRETGRVSIVRSYLGFSLRPQEIPLDQAAKAVVETARAGRSLVLLTRSGQPIALTSVTDREGYYEAANAINSFLARNPSQ